jgi:uncharacterized protein (TIGR02996 family)
MTEEQAFLQAIIEAPDDDVPRLIFADWLDDHGQPDRGDLIRVQCELARLPADDPRVGPLTNRLRRLLRRANRTAWELARPDFAGRGPFVRGFLMPSLKEPVANFIARRPEDFGPFPLWRVTLTGLANVPDRTERVVELAASANLLRAGELSLTANAIGLDGANALATCPYLKHVTTLSLRRNWMGADGLQALAESAAWPRVTHLDLGGNSLEDEAGAILARAPFLVNLIELDLEKNALRDGAIQVFSRSPLVSRLRSLLLHENYVGDGGASALARAPWARGLKVLALANQLSDVGAVVLAGAPHLDGLERLVVANNHRLGAPGCRALRERFGKRVILPVRYR